MKRSFVRKFVAVLSAMIISVAAMATTANAAAPSGGGASAGTNNFITENGIPMFYNSYKLKKEQSGTHYNIYNTSNFALEYTTRFSYDKFSIRCTSYACTTGATNPKCYMGYRTYVTKGERTDSEYVGNGFYSKFIYDECDFLDPVTIATRTKTGQFLQILITLYNYDKSSYSYMVGNYKVY